MGLGASTGMENRDISKKIGMRLGQQVFQSKQQENMENLY